MYPGFCISIDWPKPLVFQGLGYTYSLDTLYTGSRETGDLKAIKKDLHRKLRCEGEDAVGRSCRAKQGVKMARAL